MRGEPFECPANGVGLDGSEALCIFAVNSDEVDADPHRRVLASSRASGSPGVLEPSLSVVGDVARLFFTVDVKRTVRLGALNEPGVTL